MKRVIVGVVAALSLAAIAVFALGVARPDLLSKLGVKTAKADYGLFCKEHGVPEKFCTLCHVELKKTLLLCPEHGNIPEEVCTKCHAENAAKYDIKPCEHGLPAHFCPKCHPENFKVGDSTAANPNLINDGWCAAFGERGSDGKFTFCNLLPVVRLASAELAHDIGLRTALVTEEEYTHALAANAETAYDANRYAEIHPRVVGYLREPRADLGQVVEAGEVVAVIDSAEVSTAKTQYLSAYAAFNLEQDTHTRMNALTASGAAALKDEIAARAAMNQAQANLWNAEQKLRNFRFDDAALSRILRANDTRPLLEIVTPIGGTVVFRHAVLGEAIEPTSKLYTVADTSRLWLWISVYERDIAQLKAGQAVAFAISGLKSGAESRRYEGRITWVGTEVDEISRTTKVRAEVPNPGGTLMAHQFGKARVVVEEPRKTITVAKTAIQRYETADMVFLTREGTTFRPQRVKTRPIDRDGFVEVTWGLKPGQEVVTVGSFLLKTEIMKGSIGAGCCD
jgi:membrane fusion protein, heavy metal efflux system